MTAACWCTSPSIFDVRKPGVIVVFFHGNGATLERDVRDRQLVPQQITDSGANAVLLAPQMAVDAADSSAGKFWQPGGFKRFMEESAEPSRPPHRRSEQRASLRQHADRDRRLQRRLPADRVEPRGRRRSATASAAWCCSMRSMARLDKFAAWIEKPPLRLLRQLLHPLHRAARPRADEHAAAEGHQRLRGHGRAAAARQRGVRREPATASPIATTSRRPGRKIRSGTCW